MVKPLWSFEGFVTEALNRVVQGWYWDDIGIDERDDIRDRVNHLGNVERHLWKEPHFKFLGEIGEIRKKRPNGALRIYGYFSNPHVFVFLNGTLKKTNHDKQGMDTALMRLKKLKQGTGTTHEFDFEEKPA